MNNSSVSGNWEDLFDSGQVETQFRGPFNVPPPCPTSSSNSISTLLSSGGGGGGDVNSSKSLYCCPPSTQPEPKLKILKRPSSSPNFQKSVDNSSASKEKVADESLNKAAYTSSSSSERKQNKSFKQREEEYALARRRILGSSGNVELPDFSIPPPPIPAGSMLQNRPSNNQLLPRGPDGTKGFRRQ